MNISTGFFQYLNPSQSSFRYAWLLNILPIHSGATHLEFEHVLQVRHANVSHPSCY